MKTLKLVMLNVQEMDINEMRVQNAGCSGTFDEFMKLAYRYYNSNYTDLDAEKILDTWEACD